MNVTAAPNRSVITARTELVEVVEGQPKWYLTVSVLGAEAVTGGLFVHAGDTARVFAVGSRPPIQDGDEFRAEVEYIGGPGGGELQLITLDEVWPGHHDS
jgi:hypothetical protein